MMGKTVFNDGPAHLQGSVVEKHVLDRANFVRLGIDEFAASNFGLVRGHNVLLHAGNGLTIPTSQTLYARTGKSRLLDRAPEHGVVAERSRYPCREVAIQLQTCAKERRSLR